MINLSWKLTNYIKCRFCNWHTLLFRTNKKGERKHGYQLLRNHCMMHHDEKMKELKLLMYEEEEVE